MSKERLEEMLQDLPYSTRHVEEVRELADYAREKAERVQKLEEIKSEAIKQLDVAQRRNERLEKRAQELEEDNENLQTLSNINRKEHMRIHEQNKRYREAIENVLKEFGVVERLKYAAQLEKALEESE